MCVIIVCTVGSTVIISINDPTGHSMPLEWTMEFPAGTGLCDGDWQKTASQRSPHPSWTMSPVPVIPS